jgi:hypothetical protein
VERPDDVAAVACDVQRQRELACPPGGRGERDRIATAAKLDSRRKPEVDLGPVERRL